MSKEASPAVPLHDPFADDANQAPERCTYKTCYALIHGSSKAEPERTVGWSSLLLAPCLAPAPEHDRGPFAIKRMGL